VSFMLESHLSADAISVCIIAGEYSPAVGGIADYTASLAHSLRRQGVAVTICTTAPPQGSPRSVDLGQVDREMPRLTVPGWRLSDLSAIVARVRSVRPDIVHLQYQAAAYAMSPALVALPYCLGARVAFVTTFHDLRPPYLFPKAGQLRCWFNHALIGASNAVIFTDPADLDRAHPYRPAAWIPIGSSLAPADDVDRGTARARFGIAPDEAVVASFGFVNASKGFETLLRAAERLVRSRVPLRLLLIGDETGTSDPRNQETAARLRGLAASLDLSDRIIRTGFLAPSEVSIAMRAADLAALPYADGASLRRSSLLACLAHGLPVVTTQPAGPASLATAHRVAPFDDPAQFQIGPGVAALVPRGDDAALARELYRLLNDPARAERLAGAGKALVGRLDWSSIAGATRTAYERALGRAVNSRP
jgi:polysaccharide biosynthesis protein PslF